MVDDPDEMGQCLVRAVQLYLKRTKQYQPDCKCLVISTGWNKKKVSKNTISFWLHEVIEWVNQSSEGEDPLPRYCAHEIKGIAPTMLFRRNFTMDQVLKAGVWKSQITFTSFYLRDITYKSLDTFSLVTVVAA